MRKDWFSSSIEVGYVRVSLQLACVCRGIITSVNVNISSVKFRLLLRGYYLCRVKYPLWWMVERNCRSVAEAICFSVKLLYNIEYINISCFSIIVLDFDLPFLALQFGVVEMCCLCIKIDISFFWWKADLLCLI